MYIYIIGKGITYTYVHMITYCFFRRKNELAKKSLETTGMVVTQDATSRLKMQVL